MAASKKKRVVEKEMEYLENEKADSDDEAENGEDDMEELIDEEEDDAVGQVKSRKVIKYESRKLLKLGTGAQEMSS